MNPIFEDHTSRISTISRTIGTPIMTWKCPLTKAQERNDPQRNTAKLSPYIAASTHTTRTQPILCSASASRPLLGAMLLATCFSPELTASHSSQRLQQPLPTTALTISHNTFSMPASQKRMLKRRRQTKMAHSTRCFWPRSLQRSGRPISSSGVNGRITRVRPRPANALRAMDSLQTPLKL